MSDSETGRGKGTVPICRNGPEGASHKWGLSPFSPGCWRSRTPTSRPLQWATWKRQRFTGTLVAVAGGVGKTTARQMIHAVLASRLSGTACPRNFNNHFGVPLNVLGLRAEYDYAVLELSAGPAGELPALAELFRPKVAVILPTGESRQGGFGSRQTVGDATADLLAALPADGHAVLADDPWLCAAAARCAAPITWIGTSSRCHLRAVEPETARGCLGFRVAIGEPSLSDEPAPEQIAAEGFSVPAWGGQHLAAALAAVALGRMMGFDLTGIAAALANFQPLPTQCEVIEVRGATILHDARGSGAAAMRAAMELLQDFDSSGRRIVVCGDVAEPGPQAAALHWQLGKQIVEPRRRPRLLIACGPLARHVTAGARAAGMVRSRAIPCDTVDDALPYLGPGDPPRRRGAGQGLAGHGIGKGRGRAGPLPPAADCVEQETRTSRRPNEPLRVSPCGAGFAEPGASPPSLGLEQQACGPSGTWVDRSGECFAAELCARAPGRRTRRPGCSGNKSAAPRASLPHDSDAGNRIV